MTPPRGSGDGEPPVSRRREGRRHRAFTVCTASSSMTTETIISFTRPNDSTSRVVAPAPAIPPRVPPTAIRPKSRLLRARSMRSAMVAQKRDTAHMLKTLKPT